MMDESKTKEKTLDQSRKGNKASKQRARIVFHNPAGVIQRIKPKKRNVRSEIDSGNDRNISDKNVKIQNEDQNHDGDLNKNKDQHEHLNQNEEQKLNEERNLNEELNSNEEQNSSEDLNPNEPHQNKIPNQDPNENPNLKPDSEKDEKKLDSQHESEEFDSDEHVESANDWYNDLNVVAMPHLLGPSATQHSPVPIEYQHYPTFPIAASPFGCQQLLIECIDGSTPRVTTISCPMQSFNYNPYYYNPYYPSSYYQNQYYY